MAPRRMVDPRQFSLLLGDGPEGNGPLDPSDSDGVFFAVVPDPAIAPRLVRFAAGQCDQHGLTGKLRPVGRLHFSLIGLGRYEELPPAFIERAKRAASTVRMRAFVVALNQVANFGNKANPALVLRGDDGVVGLTDLHGKLGAALVAAHVMRRVPSAITPHLTLLYDPKPVARTILDAPFEWTIKEFALVHGRDRAAEFDYLERWPLDAHG